MSVSTNTSHQSRSFDIDPELVEDWAFSNARQIYMEKPYETLKDYFQAKKSIKTIYDISSSEHIDNKIGHYHNSFFSAAFIAYSYHIPLALSADNFWFQIMNEVARHINLNSDKFKKHITDATSDEKQKIDVDITGMTFEDGIHLIVSELQNKVKDKKLIEVCDGKFSTTTPLIKSCYGAVLMNSLQKFFSYKMTTRCGIKKITLLGSEQDWQNLCDRVKTLRTMPYAQGIESNLDQIIITLNKILNSYKGDVDKDFWRDIVIHQHGSGYNFISGWLADFFFYDSSDKPLEMSKAHSSPWDKPAWSGLRRVIETADIPVGYSSTPFIWDNQGSLHNMMIYSGQSGVQVLNTSYNPNNIEKSVSPGFTLVFAETV
jgi:hypothetical protein